MLGRVDKSCGVMEMKDTGELGLEWNRGGGKRLAQTGHERRKEAVVPGLVRDRDAGIREDALHSSILRPSSEESAVTDKSDAALQP